MNGKLNLFERNVILLELYYLILNDILDFIIKDVVVFKLGILKLIKDFGFIKRDLLLL